MISTILLIIITLFIPPIGVFLVAGCGADLLINICLTLLGYFPGHIHAFYVEYVYYKRKEETKAGIIDTRPAPGVFSDRVNNGGRRPVRVGGEEGHVVPPQSVPQHYADPAANQQYPAQAPPNYGTVPIPGTK
ncbi:UPF0057-domain-containing protein [Venturia nashicola]|uniref:UPF0057-domain-containing protein n=1 Tax=Venturia nashicola TaxID=86259 RepID=A0A4Z1NXU4_9PEZI|nr:UPF0057-domain-containing protein [Venturia nashicola]TLD18732.1 UPF0057-domain-containing protein [Venturia nashicola]